ncbi:MAG: transposase [Saprospiraceae bacterium]
MIYLDAIHFKVRQEGSMKPMPSTVYSVDWHGQRDLLGLYVQGSEGSSKWGLILSDLKKRGVKDVLVMCTDNLSGFSEVINESFPQAIVQKCIVHQVRNSMIWMKKTVKKWHQTYAKYTRQ